MCVRVYLQFSLDHVYILSPSAAMATHLQQKGAESGDDITGRKQTTEEEEEEDGGLSGGRKKRRRDEEGPAPSCVSMVIRLEQKEGVAWRNLGAGSQEEGAGLTLCFSARAAVIGPVVSWGRDPRNGPMTGREGGAGAGLRVALVFSGVSSRWFPLLQPGTFYRLTAHTQVLTCSCC